MKKTIIIILVGFIFAIGGGMGFLSYQKSILEPVKVYQAKTVIERGNKIKDEDIIETIVYKGNTNKNYITDRKKIVGKYAKYDFAQGDKFKVNKLSNTLDVTSIYKEILENGEVAIGINVDLSKAVGGILQKGDYVNVIALDTEGKQGYSRAKTILQHIEVLNISNKQADSLVESDGGTGNLQYADKSPAVVVLKVKQENEALLAVHSEVTLSLNSKDYQRYNPGVKKNVFEGGSPNKQINTIIGGK